jgi:hypothetical protein
MLKSLKKSIKSIAPDSLLKQYSSTHAGFVKGIRNLLEKSGYIVTRTKDYYGPTPSAIALKKNSKRWTKPSSMIGINYDIAEFDNTLKNLCNKYLDDFDALPLYNDVKGMGFGPGYPHMDAFVLFGMYRNFKPHRYLEVGSGMSTYYASCAAKKNRLEGDPSQITCVEPYPFDALRGMENIDLIQSEVQDVPIEKFLELDKGDILFIDSSHIVKIDGDVPFLLLEVIPALRPGVHIHIHDVHFPFNIPYPPELWTLLEHPTSAEWPRYWNEAMLLQALLCNNRKLEIELSTPLLRYFSESSLKEMIPFYRPISEQVNTFSSIWLQTK